MKNADVKGRFTARVERCGMLKAMQKLADGRSVFLEEGVEMFNEEHEASNTGVVDGSLRWVII